MNANVSRSWCTCRLGIMLAALPLLVLAVTILMLPGCERAMPQPAPPCRPSFPSVSRSNAK